MTADGGTSYDGNGFRWLNDVRHGLPLVIALGGLRMRVGIPPFEFRRMLEGAPANALMLRDLDQSWYQRGVRGIGDTPAAVAEFLDRTVEETGAPRVLMIGNSAGGFGAMLLGSFMTHRPEVHAISPQTFMTRRLRVRFVDPRWPKEVHRMRRGTLREPILDVATRGEHLPPTIIYYPTKYRFDRVHAERMAQFPNVTLQARVGEDHRLVVNMRDAGELERIVTGFATGDAST